MKPSDLSSVVNIRYQTSIREAMCGLRKDMYSEVFVGMLRAFVDDSGSGGDSTWFVLGGYVAHVDQWDAFDPLWLGVLHAPPRIEYFKSSEAESLKGEFLGFSVDKRNAKIDSLLDVIEQTVSWSTCTRIRQRDYDEVMKGKIPPRWDSPYYFLFQTLIGSTVTIERLHGDSEPMEFIFDSNERFEKTSYSLVKGFYSKDMFQGIANVMYRDDKKFLPLQAADLFAWQARRFLCAGGEPRRKHYARARKAGNRPPHLHIMSRQEITRYMLEIQEHGHSLGRTEDMRKW